MLKPATDFCFKASEVIWLTPSNTLELRFFILSDHDIPFTIDCYLAIVAAAFSILLVITLLDAVLMVVDS